MDKRWGWRRNGLLENWYLFLKKGGLKTSWEVEPQLPKAEEIHVCMCAHVYVCVLGMHSGEEHGFWDSHVISPAQFSSVAQPCLTRCNPMDCSMPGLPVHHHLQEFNQTHVHWVSDAIQPSHPLSSPSSPIFNLSQHQGLFKWVSSSHQVAKVLEFQLQYQSFQWTLRTDLL